jgi:hypothetical protein
MIRGLVCLCACEVLALFAEKHPRAVATLLLVQYVLSGPSWRAVPVQQLLLGLFVCTCSRIVSLADLLDRRLRRA